MDAALDITLASLLAQARGTIDWLEILIVLLVMGGSGIGWVWKTLKEKHAEKRALDERRRRQDDALRTGQTYHPPEAPATPAPTMSMGSGPDRGAEDVKRRLQELAQRRRAELEALRRNAQGGGGAPVQPTMSVPQARPVHQPSVGPAQSAEEIAERRRRQIEAQRKAQADAEARARADARQREQADKRREQQERARAKAERQRRESTVSVEAERRQQVAAAIESVVPAASGTAAGQRIGAGIPVFTGRMPSAGTPEGAAAWRQLIVANEILGRPVAMREDE